jgi:hypothetical protein
MDIRVLPVTRWAVVDVTTACSDPMHPSTCGSVVLREFKNQKEAERCAMEMAKKQADEEREMAELIAQETTGNELRDEANEDF